MKTLKKKVYNNKTKKENLGFQIKGSYKLEYTINKKPEQLIVEVELKLVEGMLNPRQNLYEGFATVNGVAYKEDLSHCVNAKLCAESIGKKLRNDIMLKCKEEKKVFKIKK